MNKGTAFKALLGISLFLMTLAWERVYSMHLGIAVSTTQKQINLKEARNNHLKFELAELKAPASLESLAETRLAMSYPDPDKIVTLEENLSGRKEQKNWLAKIFSSESQVKTN